MRCICIHTYHGVGDWAEAFLLELLNGLSVVPQVEFGTDQDDGRVGTVVAHLWEPLSSGSRKEGGGRAKGGGILKLWMDMLYSTHSYPFSCTIASPCYME